MDGSACIRVTGIASRAAVPVVRTREILEVLFTAGRQGQREPHNLFVSRICSPVDVSGPRYKSFHFVAERSPGSPNLIAASVYDKHSVGPSIRAICTKCYFTTTNVIQECSNFRRARVFIINTRPDKISVAPNPPNQPNSTGRRRVMAHGTS